MTSATAITKLQFPYFASMQRLLFGLLILVVFASCGSEENAIPRPRGYFRIDFPEKKYQPYTSDCPFTFEYPVYGNLEFNTRQNQPCWPNIVFPKFKGTIHISYLPIESNLPKLLEDSRTITYKHTVRANDISEILVNRPEAKVYGTIYEVTGNAASAIQFHLTDSANHFLRGSLYFNASPNADSLNPVVNFFRKDIDHLIGSLNWK
jgi:gliding motility-associated lipoprotein GldD